MKDVATGEHVVLENKDNMYRFNAHNIPGMGYRTYVPADPLPAARPSAVAVDSRGGILENEFLTVKVDQTSGRLISVRDKSTGREMIADHEWPFGGYVYQQFDKKQVETYAKAYIKGGWDWAPAELGRPNLDDRPGFIGSGTAPDLRWEVSANRAVAALLFKPTERIPHAYSLIYILEAGKPALEITWRMHSKGAEPWPEAGWISFPFNINSPEFRVGRLGGIADPKKDFVKGTNFDYFMTQHGVALFGTDGAGFAVTSPDAPAVSLDRPGLWTWTGDFIPKRANVFFNLFNNQWSTNFTEWIEGSWSARFYVWPFAKYDPAASLVVPAEDFNMPLYAAMASGPAGKCPVVHSGVEVSEKTIAVTAFGPVEDGGGILLRLWETAGRTVRCEVKLPEGSKFRTATAADLRNRKIGGPMEIRNGKFIATCPANRPVSLLLE